MTGEITTGAGGVTIMTGAGGVMIMRVVVGAVAVIGTNETETVDVTSAVVEVGGIDTTATRICVRMLSPSLG